MINTGLTIASLIFSEMLESCCEEQVTTQGYCKRWLFVSVIYFNHVCAAVYVSLFGVGSLKTMQRDSFQN